MKIQATYDELKRELELAYAECRQTEERILRNNPEAMLARAKRAAVSASFADASDRLNGFAVDAESAAKRNSARKTYVELLTKFQQN